MKRTDWQPKRLIERSYAQSIINLFRQIMPDSVDGFMRLPDTLRRIANSPELAEYARQAVMRMVSGTIVDGARTWRAAARQGMKSQLIYDMLRNEMNGPIGSAVEEIISRNAELISTFPLEIADQVAAYIAAEQYSGRRAASIADDLLEKYPHIAHARANLIARTETSKASTALTRARADELDLPYYVWRSSKDARVRNSHRHMDGVIINWDDPPSPEALNGMKSVGNYHAGDIYNCRCYPEPVVQLNMVNFPAKVYSGGKIWTMNRAAFERIAERKRKAA